jgi:site-specific DNA-methyltransferase (adenine-specific)
MTNQVFLMDCIEGMKQYPDKHFDLAVVDPPYGIDINKSGRLVKEKGWAYKDWDNCTPSDEYFAELVRVSKNQIIWGGNYFPLPPTKCFLIWDKQQPEGVSFASCEFAWTSFSTVAKTFYQRPQGDNRIHPTQKPIKLYDWIFKKYAQKGYKILDTHLGSQSSRIAAHKNGLDFTGFEIDKEYFEQGSERYNEYIKQGSLFQPTLTNTPTFTQPVLI